MEALNRAKLQLFELIMQVDNMELLLAIRRQVEEVTQVEKREAQLLYQLLHVLTLPSKDSTRFRQLNKIQVTRALTSVEQAEFLQLIDAEEQLRVHRVAALLELADIRQIKVEDLVRELELEQIGNVA